MSVRFFNYKHGTAVSILNLVLDDCLYLYEKENFQFSTSFITSSQVLEITCNVFKTNRFDENEQLDWLRLVLFKT